MNIVYLDQVLLVFAPGPDHRADVDEQDDDDGDEDGHALQELLQRKHRAEVDGIGRNDEVAAERSQMVAQTLRRVDRRQWSDLSTRRRLLRLLWKILLLFEIVAD